MKRAVLTSIACAILVVAGVALFSLWKQPAKRPRELQVGDLDQNGRLIFLTADVGVRKSLDYDYAMRVFYNSPAFDSGPYAIELYSQHQRKIWQAKTVEEFAIHLRALPQGVTLYCYNGGCAIPRFEDPLVWKAITHVCTERGIKLQGSEFTICTCTEE
jgi:hypothetical protein